MNKDILLERIPVTYGPSAVRVLFFENREKKHSFRMHWHERIEILRVIDGELKVNLGTKTVTAKKDEFIIIPPRMPHKGETDIDTKYCAVMFDIRNFYNNTEIGEAFLPALFEGRVDVENLVKDKETVLVLDEITAVASLPQENFLIMTKVYELLAKLFIKGALKTVEPDSSGRVMREIIDYIESHFAEEISTVDICNYFGYTIPYFCKKFKKHTGLSPMSYLKIFRMEKAYSMMKRSDLKIGEIAEKCGFADPNYFTRCFTAHFGHPPHYYIKTLRQP
jgi:AraC-like DNA-binding protein